jgi:hypothetical protein
MLDAGCSMLDAGCWMLDARCSMLDARCSMLDARCWMLDAGCSMLDAGCWILDDGVPTGKLIVIMAVIVIFVRLHSAGMYLSSLPARPIQILLQIWSRTIGPAVPGGPSGDFL